MLQKHWQLFLASILTLLGLIFISLDPLSHQVLAYLREEIIFGEWWRLFTCNFHHSNLAHLLMNCSGLLVICLLHEHHYKRWSLFILISLIGLMQALSLFIFDPRLHSYLGMSAALHGLYLWGCIIDIKKGDKTGYLLLAGILAKLIWESVFGASDETKQLIGTAVATNSHLFGAFWGGIIAFALPSLASKQLRKTKAKEQKAPTQ